MLKRRETGLGGFEMVGKWKSCSVTVFEAGGVDVYEAFDPYHCADRVAGGPCDCVASHFLCLNALVYESTSSLDEYKRYRVNGLGGRLRNTTRLQLESSPVKDLNQAASRGRPPRPRIRGHGRVGECPACPLFLSVCLSANPPSPIPESAQLRRNELRDPSLWCSLGQIAGVQTETPYSGSVS